MRAQKRDVTTPIHETIVSLSDRDVEIVLIALDHVGYHKLEAMGVNRIEGDTAYVQWEKIRDLSTGEELQEIVP